MIGPVLVLNANFEPLNVCDTRRALGLILLNKASLVMNGRGEIQTVSRAFPAPSVIRLERMIRRPRQTIRLSKREIFRRDNYTCQYCGQRPIRLTVDHVVPRHLGGEHSWENLVTACPTCNLRKGGRLPEQANMHLLHKPVEPPASAIYLFGRYLDNNSEWIPFIEGW
jgi:5-methylcytosine-specific restriction endonuclease McrA